MVRAVRLLVLCALVSCTSSQSERPRGPAGPPPPPWTGGGPSCGIALYQDPRCEAVLDGGCCTQQQACANDPGCRRLIDCWNYCESQRAVAGCNCFNNCAPQGALTPGVPLFQAVAGCSKSLRWPEAFACRTGC